MQNQLTSPRLNWDIFWRQAARLLIVATFAISKWIRMPSFRSLQAKHCLLRRHTWEFVRSYDWNRIALVEQKLSKQFSYSKLKIHRKVLTTLLWEKRLSKFKIEKCIIFKNYPLERKIKQTDLNKWLRMWTFCLVVRKQSKGMKIMLKLFKRDSTNRIAVIRY